MGREGGKYYLGWIARSFYGVKYILEGKGRHFKAGYIFFGGTDGDGNGW